MLRKITPYLLLFTLILTFSSCKDRLRGINNPLKSLEGVYAIEKVVLYNNSSGNKTIIQADCLKNTQLTVDRKNNFNLLDISVGETPENCNNIKSFSGSFESETQRGNPRGNIYFNGNNTDGWRCCFGSSSSLEIEIGHADYIEFSREDINSKGEGYIVEYQFRRKVN